MPKLPVLTARELERILKKAGFILVHSRGSHKTYHNKATKHTTTIPFHTRTIPTGTLLAIIKQAGLTKEEIVQFKRKTRS